MAARILPGLIVASVLTIAPARAADPVALYVKPMIGEEVGSGFLIKSGRNCAVLAPGHVVGQAPEADIRAPMGARGQGSLTYRDPRVDFAILDVVPSIGDCDPVASTTVVQGTISRPGPVIILSTGPTGVTTRIEAVAISIDDQTIKLRSASRPITRGMSGSPIISNGWVVGMLIADGDKAEGQEGTALRIDYIARVAGARLGAGLPALPTAPAAGQAATAQSMPEPPRDRPIQKPEPVEERPPKAEDGTLKVQEFKLPWPVDGQIIRDFGERVDGSENMGIDVAAAEGTPVIAMAEGVVGYVGTDVKAFGGLIILTHDDGIVTAYGHLKDLSVTRGQKVTRGQSIAKVGPAPEGGRAKVHFEVRSNRTPVDPLGMMLPRKLVMPTENAAATPDETVSVATITGGDSSFLACQRRLTKAGVKFKVLQPLTLPNGAGYQEAIQITSMGIPVTNLGAMTCPLAEAFVDWVQADVMAASLSLDSQVAEVETMGTYSTPQIATTSQSRLSEHAHANAVDVSAFILRDGRRITIESEWKSSGPDGQFLRQIRTDGCQRFNTTLSPDYNAAHRTHLHFDLSGNGGQSFCR